MNFDYLDIFVTISTNNIEALIDFYSHLLQTQPTVYLPGVYGEFKLQKLRLGIFQPKIERKLEFDNINSSMSLCIEVENLEQAIAYLADMGSPPSGEIIYASHGQEIYAYDPAGNRLILHQAKKKRSANC